MTDARAPAAWWRSIRGLPEFRRLLELRVVSQFGDGLFQGGLVGALLFDPQRAATPWAIAGSAAVLVGILAEGSELDIEARKPGAASPTGGILPKRVESFFR